MNTCKRSQAFSIRYPDLTSFELRYVALVAFLLLVALFGAVAGSIYTVLISLSAAMVSLAAVRFKIYEPILASVCFLTADIAITQVILGYPPLAWTANINLVGYISAMGALICYRRKWYVLTIICTLGVVVTKCAGAALVLVCFVALEHRSNRWLLGVFLIMSVAIVLTNSGNVLRLGVYSDVLLSGFNLIGKSDTVYSLDRIWHAHNILLQSLSTLGVLPTIALACAVCFFVVYVRFDASVVAWLIVSSIVDYVYWWPGVLVLAVLFVIWGMDNAKK